MAIRDVLRLMIILIPLDAVLAVTPSSLPPSPSPSPPPFSSIVIPSAKYGENYSQIINATVEYVYLYPARNVSLETASIKVESNATHSFPLIIAVRQTTGILSWQIPLLVDSTGLNSVTYNKTSRILCSTKYYRYATRDFEEFVVVSISTSSHTNVFFNLSVVEVTDFYLSSGIEKVVQISPSEPIYYGYIFPEETENISVIVRVESDNDICMTMSIQNTSCPVFDLERNVEFSGHWQTVTRKGAITVPRTNYPQGFFVVLVVKGDDVDCNGLSNSNRTKEVKLIINLTITKRDYAIAMGSATAIALLFCISYIATVVIFNVRKNRKLGRLEMINEQDEDINEQAPSPSMTTENEPKQFDSAEEDSSLDEDDIDIMQDAFSDKDVIRTKLVLSVCDLARKEPRILRHKSRLYLYYLATVAVFYTLPVVQLAVTYQRVLHTTGNQDMCYYNFLCAHPFGMLSDFNHVFSNFAYVLLGLLFIFLTYSREHESDKEEAKCYGIPQHYGLFYAMGTALIMEGILSASYHVCPNRSNFQFDTSFMYVIAVLCMIKIYQNRHPDINARAPVTFGILALIIFVGLVGVLNGSTSFWIIFTILHLLICFILTVQIYYMGRCKFDKGAFNRMILTCKHDARCGIWHLLRPVYPSRFIMLVLANMCNVGLAVLGNIYQENNFAIFLLIILMSNLILYTLFYIVMKLCNRERIFLTPAIYIILAMIFWGAALYFFVNKTISWALTPAQSRIHNKPCELLNFFDSHDIWHFLSALAMFFSFMVLLTLDDDLTDVHRSQIPVF